MLENPLPDTPAERDSDKDILPPDLREKAEKSLNETPQRRTEALRELKKLLQGQEETLTTRTDALFLLRFLRARKFEVPKAFQMIERYYRVRLQNPEIYEELYPSSRKHLFDLQSHGFLPDTDPKGRKIFVLRMGNWKPSICSIDEMSALSILAWEHALEDPRTQVMGIVVIVDLGGGSLRHIKSVTPSHLFMIAHSVQECFPMRLKAFHVLNQPMFFMPLFHLIKPFLKEKFIRRTHVHGKNLASLHKFLSPEILPEEYGGLRGPFDNGPFCAELYRDDALFRAYNAYGYRPNGSKQKKQGYESSRIDYICTLWRKFTSLSFRMHDAQTQTPEINAQGASRYEQMSEESPLNASAEGPSEENILPTDLREFAEQHLNEFPERRAQALQKLRGILAGHADTLRSRTDTLFLLRFLRVRKFDAPKAFQMIQNYYRVRYLNPELYEGLHPLARKSLLELQTHTVLSNTDPEGCKICVLRMGNWNPSICSLDMMCGLCILAWEHLLEDPRTQVKGIVMLLDLGGGSFTHLKAVTPSQLSMLVYNIQECCPLRMKAAHVLNQPVFFMPVFVLVKPFLKDKLVRRMHVHGKDLNSLHQFLPPEILPEEYGGPQGPFDNSAFCDELYRADALFQTHNTYGYRPNSPLEHLQRRDGCGDSSLDYICAMWQKITGMSLGLNSFARTLGAQEAQLAQGHFRKLEDVD
ncbi:unnamed protein product [Ixodes hexagonus]